MGTAWDNVTDGDENGDDDDDGSKLFEAENEESRDEDEEVISMSSFIHQEIKDAGRDPLDLQMMSLLLPTARTSEGGTISMSRGSTAFDISYNEGKQTE